jgi:hypothetical protein
MICKHGHSYVQGRRKNTTCPVCVRARNVAFYVANRAHSLAYNHAYAARHPSARRRRQEFEASLEDLRPMVKP